jgi:hypothetical protein
MRFGRAIQKSFLLVLAAIILGCSQPGEWQSMSALVNILSKYENLTILQVTSSFTVIAHSERLPDGESSSGISAYTVEKNAIKQVFNHEIESGYNARIEIRRDMQFSGQPIVVIKVQQGAIAEMLEVYGISNGSLILLQSLDAAAFEWFYKGGHGFAELVGIPSNVVDQTTHYFWIGSRFDHVTPAVKEAEPYLRN